MGFTERLPEVTGYALEKVLGRDGTATVYAGRQVALDRPCALKVLDPEVATDKDAVKRFLREAKLAAKLHHENVVALNDVGTDTKSGLHYIALELVDGPSLRRHLAIQGGLPEAEAVRIALGVARALEAAERSRIVHRDVRPGKILLTSRGVPKLAGLGLGRLRDLRGQTVVGTRRLGSPLFVAPEIIDGGEVDSRADLYSLGIVLFEMLTGKLPFHSETISGWLSCHMVETPKSLAEAAPNGSYPPGLQDLIDAMLAKNPKERIASAQEVLDRIQAVQAALSSDRHSRFFGKIRRGF